MDALPFLIMAVLTFGLVQLVAYYFWRSIRVDRRPNLIDGNTTAEFIKLPVAKKRAIDRDKP